MKLRNVKKKTPFNFNSTVTEVKPRIHTRYLLCPVRCCWGVVPVRYVSDRICYINLSISLCVMFIEHLFILFKFKRWSNIDLLNFKAEECKKEGNECMKQEKFVEAMLHYTKGIKLDPYNPNLYSNRSLAFLRMQQYYHAMEDAKMVILKLPKWNKVWHFSSYFPRLKFVSHHCGVLSSKNTNPT